MKVLIVGGNGQVGRALQATTPDGMELAVWNRTALDITDAGMVDVAVSKVRPAFIINAAAYTGVDRAEAEKDIAYAANAAAVGHLAGAASRCGARLVHISTDFVFDGNAGSPYRPDAAPNPLGVYGRSKLAGERLAGSDALIVRTAWVYAPMGNNFVRTMLRLMRERPQVRVVADQIGSPTYAPSLASAIWRLAVQEATGIVHYTDAGVASWYDFAVAIQEEAVALGLLERSVPVIPITTVDFPTPAVRPACCVLDKTATYDALGGPAPHWRVNLRLMLNEIRNHG